MMTIELNNFEVRAVSPERLRVGWSDDKADYHFHCQVEGDRVTRIMSTGVTDYPTIVQQDHDTGTKRGPSAGISRHSAAAPDFNEIVHAAKARIAAEGLASKAISAKLAADAEKAAALIRAKAAKVRELLRKQTLLTAAIEQASDVALAEFYDNVQNSTAW